MDMPPLLKKAGGIVEKNWRRFAFFTAASLILLRKPSLVTDPRFWAEEGSVYFAYAFGHSVFETLSFTYAGYWSLPVNLAACLSANLVPLEHAPFITTGLAFALQMPPLWIIIYGSCTLFENRSVKIAAALAVVFTLSSGEIWLNTVNSQFYLTLALVLILFEKDAARQSVKGFYRFLICAAGTSGPVATFLTPLFIYKAWSDRKRESIVQAAIISVCLTLQLAIVMYLGYGAGAGIASRFSGIDMYLFPLTLFIKNLVFPILGPSAADFLGGWLKTVYKTGSFTLPAVSFLFLAVELFFFHCFSMKLDGLKRALLLGGFFLIFILTVSSSLGDNGDKTIFFGGWRAGERYFYVPSVIIMLMLLANIGKKPLKNSRSLIAITLLALTVVQGIYSYKTTVIVQTSVSWKREIAQWRKDNSYQPLIAPLGWRVRLKSRD